MARGRQQAKKDDLREEIASLKREKILEGAVDLFYEKGYLVCTMEAIAERLGATKPFVYYHFASKSEILCEISRRATREWLAATSRRASQPLDPVSKLAHIVQELTTIVLSKHKNVSIYFREQLNLPQKVFDEIAKMRRKIDSHIRDLLAEGKERGLFVFENLVLASQVITGMISYAFAWYREPSRQTKEQIVTQMTAHVLMSVGVSKVPDLAPANNS